MDDFIILRFVLPFDFYVYYLFFIVSIVYYMYSKKSFKLLPGWFFGFASLLIGVTLFVTWLDNSFDFKVMKQIIGITFTSVAYYTFLSYNNFNLKKIFKWYITIALVVSVYGIFEEFLHLSGIHISKDIRQTTFGLYRVYSVMGEPYFLAVVLIPAFFYLFSNFSSFRKFGTLSREFTNMLIVGICFVLTFSTAGLIGFALIIIFWLYNKKYFSVTNWKIIFLPFVILLLTVLFSNVKDGWTEFNIKYTETLNAFTAKKFSKKEASSLNSSSFAIFSNYMVAKASFSDNPITGTGLGTHEKNYLDKFGNFFDKDFLTRYGAFNANDANSLFLRLMSETGLLGLSLFFIFLFKNFLWQRGYDNKELRAYTVMNQGIFIWFVVRLVRTGNYFGNGFFLFFFIYYFSCKIVKMKLREQKARLENQRTTMIVAH